MQQINIKTAIFFSNKNDVEHALTQEVLGDYVKSEVVLMLGRLGSCMHGRVFVTVVRKAALAADFAPALLRLHVNRCATGPALLSQISADMKKGWEERMPLPGAASSIPPPADEVDKLLSEARDAGLMPPESLGAPLFTFLSARMWRYRPA